MKKFPLKKKSGLTKNKTVSSKKYLQVFTKRSAVEELTAGSTVGLTDTEKLLFIACHPATPGEILIELVTHPDVRIRRAVVAHPRVPVYVLYELFTYNPSVERDDEVKRIAQERYARIKCASNAGINRSRLKRIVDKFKRWF